MMAKAPEPAKQVKPRKVRLPAVKQPKINGVHDYDTSPMGYKKGCQ